MSKQNENKDVPENIFEEELEEGEIKESFEKSKSKSNNSNSNSNFLQLQFDKLVKLYFDTNPYIKSNSNNKKVYPKLCLIHLDY